MFNRSLPEPIYETLRTFAESQAVWDLTIATLVFSVIGFACVYVLRRFLIAKQGPIPLTDRKSYKDFKAGRP